MWGLMQRRSLLSPAAPRVYEVAELTNEIRSVLEVTFDEVWVCGEVRNFKRHSSGHIYFSLHDDRASLAAAFFRQWNRFLAFDPRDGDQVIVHGRLSVYEPRGSYQILVDRMEPAGDGLRKLQLEALKARLATEGLFDPARKRPIPLFPRCIGVATSPTGAVIRDILTVTRRMFPNVHILVAPCRVQGEGAAKEVAQAIARLNCDGRPDVLIVGRGGGSAEDLWTFNEEIVCRAIAASAIPVISAVGHETDTTLADLVADLRAATPSAAAAIIVGPLAQRLDDLKTWRERLERAIRRVLNDDRAIFASLRERLRDPRARLVERVQRVHELRARLSSVLRWRLQKQLAVVREAEGRLREVSPQKRLAHRRLKIEALTNRLGASIQMRKAAWRTRLEREIGRLDALSPLAVLSRGYAIVFGPTGMALRQASEASLGDRIVARLNRGRLIGRVEEVIPE